MNNWEHNGTWCEKVFPDLWQRLIAADNDSSVEVVNSRIGDPSLKVGSIQIHSSYNPAQEAERLAEKSLTNVAGDAVIVLSGFGLGYLAEALRKKFTGQIIVVEPDSVVVKAAFEARSQDYLQSIAPAFGMTMAQTVDVIEQVCGNNAGWKKVKVIQHAPSVKLRPEFYSELIRTINSRRNLSVDKLGILVVTPMYGGSLPVARCCMSAFERMGHRVETLDNEIYDAARQQIENISGNRHHRGQLTGLLTTLMAESITAKAIDRAVDLVFLVAQSPMTPDVIRELRRRKIPTAFWFVEDWRLFTYWQDWAPLYDYFFPIQKGPFLEALARKGVRRAHYLPMAADPDIHRPVILSDNERNEYGSHVSHVGAGYHNRRQVFSGLTDLDFKLWGNGWEESASLAPLLQRNGARLTTEETIKVFNASDININLHSSPYHDGVNPEGDFVNPRTFEVAASGAFQVIDHREYLPELFVEGEEIAVFRHASELRSLIAYYLENPTKKREMALKARRRVLAEHTYEHRLTEALNYIYSYETTPASRHHPDHIDNLLIEAENDDDLADLLTRFKNQGVVTLEDIVSDIQARPGELTRSETIFLLMHEFRRWAHEKELV